MMDIMRPYLYKHSDSSIKHRRFVDEPIGNKDVTAVGGITHALGTRLRSAGYGSAYALLGKYVMFNRDSVCFQNWLQKMCGANIKQTNNCYRCLNDWYMRNIAH